MVGHCECALLHGPETGVTRCQECGAPCCRSCAIPLDGAAYCRWCAGARAA